MLSGTTVGSGVVLYSTACRVAELPIPDDPIQIIHVLRFPDSPVAYHPADVCRPAECGPASQGGTC